MYQPHPYANIFPMMSEAEKANLIRSMQEDGYDSTMPIVLHEGLILDGRNRYEAAQAAGIEPVFTTYEGIDPLAFVIRHNLHRRHLNETQRGIVASKLATMEQGGDGRNQHEGSANLRKAVTQSEAAQMLNVSERTIQTIKAVEREAPDLVSLMESGQLKASAAMTEAKRRTVSNTLASIEVQEVKQAQGIYDVIVLDPPWQMEKIEREVAPNQVGFDYPTMPIEDIKSMKIPAADNCHVFMWTTQKFLKPSFEIFEAWGVKYVCTFNWHKAGGFQPFGLPQYNNEFCLYGRIGTPIFLDTKNFKTSFEAKRGKHSEKPEEFYEMLRRVTGGRRLDMFNRRLIDGFDGYGNEAK